jgi:hypothetical protein
MDSGRRDVWKRRCVRGWANGHTIEILYRRETRRYRENTTINLTYRAQPSYSALSGGTNTLVGLFLLPDGREGES